ncbi:MAG: cytochrome B, partial [Gammaproteobacteria bacterium HGW-Gammaproteobacteria-10]
MSWKNTPRHYGSLAIGLHWLIFLLMVGLYACIELRVLYPKGSDPREALKMWHFMLGLSVGLLVWLRLTVRLSNVKPVIEPA